MVEIRNVPGSSVVGQEPAKANEVAEAKKGPQASSDVVTHGAQRVDGPASTLPAPAVPLTSLSAAQIDGAESFAAQLEAMGAPVRDLSPDVLLAAFLKLQVLNQSKEDTFSNLASEGHSILTQLALHTVRAIGAVAASSYALQLGLEAALQATTNMSDRSMADVRELLAEAIRQVFEKAMDKPDEKERPVGDKDVEKKFGRSSAKAPSAGGTGVIGVQSGEAPPSADGPGGFGSLARAGMCAEGGRSRIAHLVRAQAGHDAALARARL